MKTSIRLAIGAAALTTVLWTASPSLAQPPQRQQPSAWCYYHSCPESLARNDGHYIKLLRGGARGS